MTQKGTAKKLAKATKPKAKPSLKKLLTRRKKIVLEIGEENVELYIRKPNMFDEEEAKNYAQIAMLNVRYNKSLLTKIKQAASAMSREELIAGIISFSGVGEALKMRYEIMSENDEFANIDELEATVDKLDEDAKKEAQAVIDRFYNELQDRILRYSENEYQILSHLTDEELRDRFVNAQLESAMMTNYIDAANRYYIMALIEDEEGNRVFNSIEEVEAIDDQVLAIIKEELADLMSSGVELKKVSSTLDF